MVYVLNKTENATVVCTEDGKRFLTKTRGSRQWPVGNGSNDTGPVGKPNQTMREEREKRALWTDFQVRTWSCPPASRARWARALACRRRLVRTRTSPAPPTRRRCSPSYRPWLRSGLGPWPGASGRTLCPGFDWPPSCPGAADTPAQTSFGWLSDNQTVTER